MSSLQINDDLENLDSSLIMNQDEQNNAEPGQDSPPTDRKRSSRFKVYVDKSNGHGSNEKVLENTNKKRNSERKPTSHSKKHNRSNRHGNSVNSFNQTKNNSRDPDKNSIAENDCVLLTNDLTDFWDEEDIIIKCTTHGTSMEQSVHYEPVSEDGQDTDNMSDGDEISESEDINDCGMNPVLIHPRIMSTDRSSRPRTIIDPTSPSSRRNLRLRRRRSSPYRCYRRESRDHRYRSDSPESHDRRYRSDSRECRDSCYRSDSREDCDRRYRRDSRECRNCCYLRDSLECPDRRFCINSRDHDDQCDLCGNRFSSNVFMLRPYRP